VTQSIFEGDLVVAILDGFAVIKKLELVNNAVILRPVSSDPQYKPIIMHKDFKLFGKVIDIIRLPQKGDIEIVPLYTT
jgi:SOS-response transcriptional repressor LexA